MSIKSSISVGFINTRISPTIYHINYIMTFTITYALSQSIPKPSQINSQLPSYINLNHTEPFYSIIQKKLFKFFINSYKNLNEFLTI